MEYLLVDAGYGLCDYICTPYRHPLAAVHMNQLFNVWYSSGRVTIEHVNGRIKSRFGSLNGIRCILVQKLEDFERVNISGLLFALSYTICLHDLLMHGMMKMKMSRKKKNGQV